MPESVEKALNLCNDGLLLDIYGSRSVPWRIFLGLLNTDSTKWSKELALQRKNYSDLLEKYSIKSLSKNKQFNPLAPV